MITLCERCLKPVENPEEHGLGLCPLENRRQATVIFQDEIPGGQTYENYGPQPVTFYSHSERRAYMAAHGLAEAERWCPTPGTDKDPAGIPNPKAYIDPQTMENAKVLLSRVKRTRAEMEREVEEAMERAVVRPFVLVDGGKDAQAIVNGDARRASRFFRRTVNGDMDAGRGRDAQQGVDSSQPGGDSDAGVAGQVRYEA